MTTGLFGNGELVVIRMAPRAGYGNPKFGGGTLGCTFASFGLGTGRYCTRLFLFRSVPQITAQYDLRCFLNCQYCFWWFMYMCKLEK